MSWDKDIQELDAYFKKAAIPTEPLKLNQYSTKNHCALYIISHITTVKANNGKITYLPYLNRLKILKNFLDEK